MNIRATKQGLKRVIPKVENSIEYTNRKLKEKLSKEEIEFWMMFRSNEIKMSNWFRAELKSLTPNQR